VNVVWPVSLGVAATETEIGLAWAELDPLGPAIRFARLAPDLELLSASKLEGLGPTVQRASVAVAALASGWIVGVYNSDGVAAILADSTGAFAARTVFDPPPVPAADVYGANPVFAPRPGAGPLMVWRNGTALRASVIAMDGRSATTPIDVALDGSMYPGSVSAVFFEDAFYVAVVVALPTATNQLRLVRVAQDGSASTTMSVLPGDSIYSPTLVAGDHGLSLVYEGQAPASTFGMLWRRIGVGGEPLGPPVSIDASQRYSDVAHPVAVGDDIVILAGAQASIGVATALGIVRIDAQGQMREPAFDIAIGQRLSSYDIVARGSDLIAAWIGGGADRIGVARLRP
jgi:hypothetical protein